MAEEQYIGPYLIESRLGSGRYSEVYRAIDTVHKRTVTVKVIRQEFLSGLKDPTLFLQKVQLAADLIHPHIAWVWDIGIENQLFYLAERFIDGPTLGTILAESGTLALGQVLPVFAQTAQGLDYAHSRGWIHGDITPNNILVSIELGAVVTDFGLMRALQEESLVSGRQLFSGTPPYVAPEISRGDPYNVASDQYSLASVILEALYGHDICELISETLSEHPEARILPASSIDDTFRYDDHSSFPIELESVFKRALAIEPINRFPSVNDFVTALEEAAPKEEQIPDSHESWEIESRAILVAEEKQRQAALEQARFEIEEELKREKAEHTAQVDTAQNLEEANQPQVLSSSQRREKEQTKGRWVVWLFPVVLVILMIGYWLITNTSRRENLLDAPTHTYFPTAENMIIIKETATPIATFPPSNTPTPTQKILRSPTLVPSFTPQPSLSLTHTNIPTRISTATRASRRIEREKEFPIGSILD